MNEMNEIKAMEMAAARMAAASEKQLDAKMAAMKARFQAQKEQTAVADLATQLGACFGSVDAIKLLRAYFGKDAADVMESMVNRGILGYDENLCAVTLAMG